ncbi:ANL_HP_G0066640.mRNA.1.CDS.1 [Saccharomyces cerevisiae]|nr:ANL_HP_G0066640.mRNA.1.CDS.1 [Saccharomyces cerevisiae]CAI6931083.1 ANL_HP_G0066640.mRNA.1.CDS.1 [Saccharomyces cerevisiae]
MPSYDQLMEEAERRFYSYQYKYEGFQRIERYSIFCPWKNTQREIDLVLDHIHFSLDVGEKNKVDPNIQIKPYQIFPSNNLVYEGLPHPAYAEGLPHPAEQSLILSPDTSLIERAFQALIDICKESIPSSNDCTTRNTKSAPQLTVPEPSRPCRLLLVRGSRTATELETNKKLWLHSKRREYRSDRQCILLNMGQKAGYENGSQLLYISEPSEVPIVRTVWQRLTKYF